MPNPTPDMPRLPVLLLSLAARHTVVAVALHEIRDRFRLLHRNTLTTTTLFPLWPLCSSSP